VHQKIIATRVLSGITIIPPNQQTEQSETQNKQGYNQYGRISGHDDEFS